MAQDLRLARRRSAATPSRRSSRASARAATWRCRRSSTTSSRAWRASRRARAAAASSIARSCSIRSRRRSPRQASAPRRTRRPVASMRSCCFARHVVAALLGLVRTALGLGELGRSRRSVALSITSDVPSGSRVCSTYRARSLTATARRRTTLAPAVVDRLEEAAEQAADLRAVGAGFVGAAVVREERWPRNSSFENLRNGGEGVTAGRLPHGIEPTARSTRYMPVEVDRRAATTRATRARAGRERRRITRSSRSASANRRSRRVSMMFAAARAIAATGWAGWLARNVARVACRRPTSAARQLDALHHRALADGGVQERAERRRPGVEARLRRAALGEQPVQRRIEIGRRAAAPAGTARCAADRRARRCCLLPPMK